MSRERPSKHVFFYLLFIFALVITPIISKVDVVGNYNTLSNETSKRYAVIFDAESTGSRVHVFSFDQNLNFLPVGDAIELSLKIKPGLSSFASKREAAATSLEPLLEQAQSVIPAELQPKTPMKLAATGGLRRLREDVSNQILQAVRNLLKEKGSLEYKPEWVKISDGSEGEFMWVAINYPLGTLGKSYSNSVGIIDLGGSSVQMAYAISEEEAEKAPRDENGDSTYVKNLSFKQTKYNLYVYSYLNYGLLAARAEILKTISKSGSPCILSGYHGTYTYNGVEYNASSSSSSSFLKCRKAVLKALNINAPCPYKTCTFQGVWNGGGGPGQNNLYVASFFYDIAANVGIIEKTEFAKKVKPADFGFAAQKVCSMSLDEAKINYPNADSRDFPFLCIDLTYQYMLLVQGFGIHPRKEITLLTKLKYGNYFIDAAWPFPCWNKTGCL